jgi:hypothetical protein
VIQAQIKIAVSPKIRQHALVAKPHLRRVAVARCDLEYHRDLARLKNASALLLIGGKEAH